MMTTSRILRLHSEVHGGDAAVRAQLGWVAFGGNFSGKTLIKLELCYVCFTRILKLKTLTVKKFKKLQKAQFQFGVPEEFYQLTVEPVHATGLSTVSDYRKNRKN
jgi:hypothetical protein